MRCGVFRNTLGIRIIHHHVGGVRGGCLLFYRRSRRDTKASPTFLSRRSIIQNDVRNGVASVLRSHASLKIRLMNPKLNSGSKHAHYQLLVGESSVAREIKNR